LGLLREQEGVAAQVLMNLGLKLEEVRTEVLQLLSLWKEKKSLPPRMQPCQPVPDTKSPPSLLDASAKSRPVSTQEIAHRREAELTATMRVLDASFNRAMEGLRVSEDFVRFALNDHHLTEALKSLRHDLLSTIQTLPRSQRIASRDISSDVGTAITVAGENDRQGLSSVFFANIQRARQSLRSLEEFGKTIETQFGKQMELLRYRLYTLEKAVAITYEAVDNLAELPLCVLVHGCDSLPTFSRLTKQLVHAGIGMIQLRDKCLGDDQLVERARVLVKLVRAGGSPSPDPALRGRRSVLAVVNDRPDIAAAVDADGVHLGQEDLSVKDARAILGPDKLIGVSTHSLDQARASVLDGANYLGAGPTFPSSTKAFEVFPGLEFLRALTEEIRLPTFAIGGINTENVPQVLATGIHRIAVGSAITDANDPVDAARQILQALGNP
ncbi:MAG: thiamine phosphate synthase, partial [Pirellulales bacterium]|nr:thiamine phosphate synthase [Pirellulales bacterium]